MTRQLGLAAGLAVLAGVLCSGCNGPIHLRIQPHVARPNPRVVLFFVDGVDRASFRKWLAAGELPNIKRYLVDRGTQVENAVSCLPSITYANTATFLTGRYPGHHGVLANKWLDRERLWFQDYCYGETYRRINNDVVGPTIYELLSDKHTVSIQSPLTRGVKRTYYNDITASVTWWLGLLDWTDRLMPLRFEEIAQEISAAPNGQWPHFVHAYFPATDEYGHRYGSGHWGYKYAVQNADHQIGRICGGLETAGLLERTNLVFVSDHGMTDIARDRRLYVGKALAGQFGRTVTKGWPEFENDYTIRQAQLAKYDTVTVPGAGRKCAVYFRFAQRWADRPTNVETASTYSLRGKRGQGGAEGASVSETVRWLARRPEVLIAAVPTGLDAVALHGGGGVALVTRSGAGRRATYRYVVREGDDPLSYQSHEPTRRLMDGGFHPANAWLAATVGTDAPDIPGQICAMFDSHRAGDVMLFAARGCGFSWWENAGHGSITASDMFVPMVWAGPDVAVGATVPLARTCDVMPTILDILGRSDRLADHPPIDGVSLLPQLRGRQVAAAP